MTANALHPGVISTKFGKGESVIFSGNQPNALLMEHEPLQENNK